MDLLTFKISGTTNYIFCACCSHLHDMPTSRSQLEKRLEDNRPLVLICPIAAVNMLSCQRLSPLGCSIQPISADPAPKASAELGPPRSRSSVLSSPFSEATDKIVVPAQWYPMVQHSKHPGFLRRNRCVNPPEAPGQSLHPARAWSHVLSAPWW